MADYKVIAKPRDSLAKDSWEFAVQTLRLLKTGYEYKTISSAQFEDTLEEAKKYRIFERLPDTEHPYGNFDAMLQAEIGASEDEAKERKLLAHRRPTKEEQENYKASNRRFKFGTTVEYQRARLQRDYPDILEALDRGEYRSTRQAAIAAGFVKELNNLEKAQKAFENLTKAERKTFLNWITETEVTKMTKVRSA